MADSKISQLPLSPYVLDKDLMVVVTGHLEEGAHPDNVKVPLGYIRRYIVRLNLLTSPQSGIGSYYNSGLNILTLQHIPQTGNLMRYDYADEFPYHQTISNTGLNTIRGNLVDITFAKDSDASQRMHYAADGNWNINFVSGNLGDPYHSGIISITGLNAYSGAPWGNLMRLDIDTDTWPHSGILSTTGLNAIWGNGIDIVFNSNSLAAQAMDERESSWFSNFDSSTHLGNKYHSGIISVTGLNAYSGAPYGNLMRVDYDVDLWPYSGVLSTTGLNAILGNGIDIVFNANSLAAQAMDERDSSWFHDFDSSTHLGNKYHSGIISVTGLNAYSGAPWGNLMRVDYIDQWPYSGILSTTGLNAIVGNGIDIVFNANSLAAQAMDERDSSWYNDFSSSDNLGSKYHSGIISVTGLNAYSGAPWGNLMRVDFIDQWPYSGILSQTGLNAIVGNGIDIVFNANSLAAQAMDERNSSWYNDFNSSTNLGERYHSGIISVTGLNAYSGAPYGNLMRVDYDVDLWPYSGVLSTTGLNAIRGNGIDIIFNSNSPAAQAMDSRDSSWYNDFDSSVNLGNKYHSGVISVTGLNAYSGAPWGNLMRVDYDGAWPHSGILSTTGVNAIKGNLVDIQFAANSEAAEAMHQRNGPWDNAFNKNTNLGNKYHSGIISFTGVNFTTENNIVLNTGTIWPYSGLVYNTGLNAIEGHLININFNPDLAEQRGQYGAGEDYWKGIISTTGLNIASANDANHTIGYNINPYYPHDYSLTTADRLSISDSNISLTTSSSTYVYTEDQDSRLYFGDLYQTFNGVTLDFLVSFAMTEPASITAVIPDWSANRATELTSAPGQLQDWYPQEIVVANSTVLVSQIYTFNGVTTSNIKSPMYHTVPASTYNGYSTNITLAQTFSDIETLRMSASVPINSNVLNCNIGPIISVRHGIQNLQYQRIWYNSVLGQTYTTPLQNATSTTLTLNSSTKRALKLEAVYDPPDLRWILQPPSQIEADRANGRVIITGIAIASDYTPVTYQWYQSADNITFEPMGGQTNAILNTTISNTRYFKNQAKTFMCDSSFSNTCQASLPGEAIICGTPTDVITCDGASTSFSAPATVEGAPTAEIEYRWYENNIAIYDGEYSKGTYNGTDSASLNISDIDINQLRGNLYKVRATYTFPAIVSSGYLIDEYGLNYITTEAEEGDPFDRLITEQTYTTPGGFLQCYSPEAKLWEAVIDEIDQISNYESIRDWAVFSGSVTGYAWDGTNQLSTGNYNYSWQKSSDNGITWNGASSNSPNLNTMGSLDYPEATGYLGGNTVPREVLFLNTASGDNGNLYRQITNYYCASNTGNPAVLTVRTIAITGHPDDTELGNYKFPNNLVYNNVLVPNNNNINIEVDAVAFNSTATLHYQWQEADFVGSTTQIDNNSWTDINGATSNSYSRSIYPTAENNTGLYKAYRVIVDDTPISVDDTISTLKRKTSDSVKVGTPAYVANTNVDEIQYFTSTENWLIDYQGETDDIDPAEMIISGLRPLFGLDYDVSIRSIITDDSDDEVATLELTSGVSPIVSITSINNSLVAAVSEPNDPFQDLNTNDYMTISVTGEPTQWFAKLTIPSG